MAKGLSTIQRLAGISATLIPTALSVTLLSIRNKKYHGDFPTFVQNNRTTIQIVVQLFAHTLAILQLWVVRTLYNYATRIRLQDRIISLNQYGLWSAISQLTVDWTVSKRQAACLSIAVILSLVPGALWTGALTPVAENDVELAGTFLLPLFKSASNSNWNSEFSVLDNGQIWNLVDTCKTISDARGFLPTCPVPGFQGQLLLSASTATPNDASVVRTHSKLDNPSWSYHGRSYGVGSAVGLTAPAFSKNVTNTVSYSFLESGYKSNVNCFRNDTSQLQFVQQNDSSPDYPLYQLEGAMSIVPQDLPDNYPVTTWYPNYERLLAWKARSYESKNLISIASGLSNYTLFHHIECTVDFEPSVFEVFVNESSKSIKVSPTTMQPSDIEPTGNLIANVMFSMNLLSRMSNSNYVSVRGEALQNNYLNMLQRTGQDNEDTVLMSVQDSMTAMIDDILVAYGASQTAHTTDTSTVTATIYVQGIRIGRPIYTDISFALNCALILAMVVEAVRSRMWTDLPVFDYSNIKCAIFAASNGGNQLASQVTGASIGKWDGDPDNDLFSKVNVALSEKGGLPQLLSTGENVELRDSYNDPSASQSALLRANDRSYSPAPSSSSDVHSLTAPRGIDPIDRNEDSHV